MPPRSVLYASNVFNTLGQQPSLESVRELFVQGEEKKGKSVLGKSEGKDQNASSHIKHDSMQSSSGDAIVIATKTTTTLDNISPLTLNCPSNDVAAAFRPTICNPLTASCNLGPTKTYFNTVRSCNNCGFTPATSENILKQCSRCKSVMYCSPKCQKSDWSSHKKACTPRAPRTPTIDITDTKATAEMEQKHDDDHTPNMSGASTPVSPSEDGTTSSAATSPGLYTTAGSPSLFSEYKTELINTPSATHA